MIDKLYEIFMQWNYNISNEKWTICYMRNLKNDVCNINNDIWNEIQIKFPIYQKSDLIKDETVAEPVFCKVGKNFL